MEYRLRPYQQAVVDFAIPRLKANNKPLQLSLGMAMGKSWVLAEIAKRWGEKTLILTLSKELCEQDYEKLKIVMDNKNVGMYSASWGKKETEFITVATIQSAYKHPELWKDYSLIIVDENDEGSVDGMLGKLIKDKHVVGLTATPFATVGSRKGRWYTTKLWPLHKIKSKDFGWYWQPCEYVLSEKDLLDMGYLTPIKIFASPIECWRLRLQSNGSEYTKESINDWVNNVLYRGLEVMVGAEKNGYCHSGIVFMPTVESCEALEKLCYVHGVSAKAIHYNTPAKERDAIVEAHKNGQLTWLINQNIATRGFDNPMVDCMVNMRATKSLRLWRQMEGRLIRLSPNKTTSYIFDLTNNSKDFGNIEDVVMGKNG